MDAEPLVRSHYSSDDLGSTVTAALASAGVDLDHLQVGDLAGLDQLHAGGLAATEHLLDQLGLAPGARLLDVGCGIGGPSRVAAHRHRCQVTGIDLSPDFIAVAGDLTRRLGLDGSVSFDVGSVTELPYADASFSRAMMNHVGMNIADKARVFAEVRRVLEPGGRFAVYDEMRTGDGEYTYPLPWADDSKTSFVETRERYAQLLRAAGFSVEEDEDRTPANAAGGPPAPGALTPADLFGEGFAERMVNNITAAMNGSIAAVLMVTVAQ